MYKGAEGCGLVIILREIEMSEDTGGMVARDSLKSDLNVFSYRRDEGGSSSSSWA